MIKLSPKLRRNLFRVIPFGIIWLIIGWVTLYSEYAIVSIMEPQEVPQTAISISPKIVLFASISVFFIGCFVGFLEIAFINRYFIKSSFPKKIISKFLIYGVLMFILIFIFYMLAASIEMEKSIVSQAVFDRYLSFLFSITHLSTNIQILFSLIVSLLYAEISDNLGQNVLLNFFTGKYHKPVVENRIFMFTDMKDSTTIAEKFGHVKYFEYLKSYYNDLSNAVIKHFGEVYQYIGDEIVISWNSKKKNAVNNSIACFFSMKEDLTKKREWYLETFGISPDFKGALHLGEVATGEIGALKKEIFFTGDVLNTTARMQSLCKEYQVDLLVSEKLLKEFANDGSFVSDAIGEVTLKGKSKKYSCIRFQNQFNTCNNFQDETFLSFLFLLIIFTTSGQNTMTKKQVVEDYTIFKNILTQSHPSLYEYTNENEWNDLFSKFEIQLDSIQDSATFFRKLSELGIHVRDGHFNILHYRMQSVPPLFPLLLKIIDEELYHDTNDFDIPLASKIVSIDGISGKDLIQRMYKYAPSDGYNTTRKHRQIEFEFGILHLYEFGSKKSYSVVYETPSGERQTTNIQSQSFQSIGQRHVQRSSLFINFYKSQIDPNYLNQKDNFPKVFFIPSKNTAILKVPSFGVNPEEFKSRVLSIFDDLKKKKIKSLIIDVRKNAGGYRANAITLFSLITDKSFQQRTSEKIITSQLIEKKHIKHTMQDYGSFLNSYFVDSHKKTLTTDRAKKMMKPHKKRFKGKVYVLIDGQTFSAASTFALSAKNDSKIQLVGESTGGGYYFHTGQFPVTYQLPHSKNFIRISLVHINHFVKDKTLPKGSGVLPDNEINLTRQDLIKGEDTVMKHVLEKASQ